MLALLQVQLHNAAMASVPGHPFWLQVLKEALKRAPTAPTSLTLNPAITPGYYSGLKGFSSVAAGVWGSAGSRSRQLLNKLQQLWELTPWHDKANAVLWSTGPMLLTSVYKVRCHVVQSTVKTFVIAVEQWSRLERMQYANVFGLAGPMLLTLRTRCIGITCITCCTSNMDRSVAIVGSGTHSLYGSALASCCSVTCHSGGCYSAADN
jgi:hypothetical protein